MPTYRHSFSLLHACIYAHIPIKHLASVQQQKVCGCVSKIVQFIFFFFIFFFFGVRVSFVAFFLLVFDSNMHYSFGCCSRCSCCYCIWFSLNYERTLAHIHTHIYRYNIHNYLLVRYTSTLHYSFSLSHSRYLYLSLCLFP